MGRIKIEGTHESEAETVMAGEFGNEGYPGAEKRNIIIQSEYQNLRLPLVFDINPMYHYHDSICLIFNLYY